MGLDESVLWPLYDEYIGFFSQAVQLCRVHINTQTPAVQRGGETTAAKGDVLPGEIFLQNEPVVGPVMVSGIFA